jgi:hypothetical protein
MTLRGFGQLGFLYTLLLYTLLPDLLQLLLLAKLSNENVLNKATQKIINIPLINIDLILERVSVFYACRDGITAKFL